MKKLLFISLCVSAVILTGCSTTEKPVAKASFSLPVYPEARGATRYGAANCYGVATDREIQGDNREMGGS